MTEDLENEVEAINSIYGDRTLIPTDEEDIYILLLPGKDASLRLQFPIDYPATPPAVLGTQSSGEHTKKGEAAHVVDIFRDVLGKLYQPGDVCLFNVIEEINSSLASTMQLRLKTQRVPHAIRTRMRVLPRLLLQIGTTLEATASLHGLYPTSSLS